MINGAHTIIYAKDAEATRAFFRDVLEWPYVDEGGWPIFRQPASELGIHPTGHPGGEEIPQGHELFLLCDDVDKTVAALREKGVEFDGGVREQSWGRLVTMLVPGAGKIGLYEPKHQPPPA